jgi:hypothetical protein
MGNLAMSQKREFTVPGQPIVHSASSGGLSRRSFITATMATAISGTVSTDTLAQAAKQFGDARTQFKRIPTQFIAALGDPEASSGAGAEGWGLWRLDPGPRGVRLGGYEKLRAADGVTPHQWEFDDTDWWLEEHGLIMEQPEFFDLVGRYVVTGDREATAVLTIHPMGTDGNQRWELSNGATLYDVTHLACRSARYTPDGSGNACSPAYAPVNAFPVSPGGPMPAVENCNKLDYTVLLVIGVAVD